MPTGRYAFLFLQGEVHGLGDPGLGAEHEAPGHRAAMVQLGHAAGRRADEGGSSGSHAAILGRRSAVKCGLRPKVHCRKEAPGPAAACGCS